jgi:hypothetical protein
MFNENRRSLKAEILTTIVETSNVKGLGAHGEITRLRGLGKRCVTCRSSKPPP